MSEELAISAVSLAELHYGVPIASSSRQRALRMRRVSMIENRFTALPLDDAVARAYGEVAATAVAHDAIVYTRNLENLRGLQDLVDVCEL